MNTNKTILSALLVCVLGISIQAQNTEIFMAITKNGTNGYIGKTIDNGKSIDIIWDSKLEAKTGQNRLFDIAYGDGILVAVGNIMLSSKDDGKTWTESNLYFYTGDPAFANRRNIVSVAYGNGFFVAAAPYHFIYSKDGISWKYVRTGELTAAEKNAKDKPSGLSLEDIEKDPKLHGKRPSVGEFPPEISPGLQFPRAVIFANGKFYVTGGSGKMTGKVLKIDGDKIVVEKDLPFSGEGAKLSSGGLEDIAWDGKSTFVATSISTKSAYSTDMGATWKYIENPKKNQIWGLAYGNGTWVAASPFEDAFLSSDITKGWTESVTRGGGRAPVNDMIYTNGTFILTGGNNAVFVSTDGKNWERTSELEFGYTIHGITTK